MPQETIIARNLRRIMFDKGITQAEFSRRTGVSKATISAWMNGTRVPRMHNIDALAEALGVTRVDLVGEELPDEEPYYINEETAQIAQEVYDDPDLRLLFDASRGVSPENIRLAAEMLKRMKGTNPDG